MHARFRGELIHHLTEKLLRFRTPLIGAREGASSGQPNQLAPACRNLFWQQWVSQDSQSSRLFQWTLVLARPAHLIKKGEGVMVLLETREQHRFEVEDRSCQFFAVSQAQGQTLLQMSQGARVLPVLVLAQAQKCPRRTVVCILRDEVAQQIARFPKVLLLVLQSSEVPEALIPVGSEFQTSLVEPDGIVVTIQVARLLRLARDLLERWSGWRRGRLGKQRNVEGYQKHSQTTDHWVFVLFSGAAFRFSCGLARTSFLSFNASKAASSRWASARRPRFL